MCHGDLPRGAHKEQPTVSAATQDVVACPNYDFGDRSSVDRHLGVVESFAVMKSVTVSISPHTSSGISASKSVCRTDTE